MTASDDALSDLPDMAEGLHLRLKRAARENSGYEQIAQAALTKRYSMPRIKRAMLHSLLAVSYTHLAACSGQWFPICLLVPWDISSIS